MLQGRLFAEGARSVLLVLQGLDASGKDGVIRRVFRASTRWASMSSRSVRRPRRSAHTTTSGASTPSCRPAATIGVFNRSHYEDVVAVRMHALAPEEVWRRRPGHIRDWERMLVDEGTTIVKVFLNVSKEEQRKRFQERIDDPEKRWKFRTADLDVRERFDEYLDAWDEVIARDVDRVGAVARRPRRPELGQEHGRRDLRRRHARAPRPTAARSRARASKAW